MSEETIQIAPYHDMTSAMTVDISVADLESLGFTRTVVKPWKPVVGDACWYNSTDDIYGNTWNDNKYDKSCWNLGNCYKTEAEAIEARDKQLATMRVLRRLRELEGDWVADLSDGMQVKTTPCYDCNSNSMVLMSKYSSVSAPPAWHSTYKAWEQVIEELEQDVKLMLGVE